MIISHEEKKLIGRSSKNHFNYTWTYFKDNHLQITWYPENQIYGRNGGRKKVIDINRKPINHDRKELYRYQARMRAGSVVRQLVKENDLKYMWTLTYKDEITNRESATNDFKNFVKRLSYVTGEKIEYVAVIEIQKKRYKKTGTPVLHFHMAINKYIKFPVIAKAWSHGWVFVSTYSDGKKIEGKNSISSYLSKYLKKDMEENQQFEGKKMYLNSRGLKRPNRGHGVASETEREELQEIADNFVIDEERGLKGSIIDVNKIYKKVKDKLFQDVS